MSEEFLEMGLWMYSGKKFYVKYTEQPSIWIAYEAGPYKCKTVTDPSLIINTTAYIRFAGGYVGKEFTAEVLSAALAHRLPLGVQETPHPD